MEDVTTRASSEGRGDLADLSAGTITFIGTATTLIRYAGFTILTDPNFLHRGQYAHLGYGLRSRRRTDPALDIERMPPIDLVVLSHLHEDHFDRLVERRLNRALPIVTTPQAAVALRAKGFGGARGLETWQQLLAVRGDARLRITSMPGRHGPPLVAWALPSVMGSMLEFTSGASRPLLQLYITGDTLVYDDLHEIPRRYPEIDLALLHLGGTRIFRVLLTMDARQGVECLRIVRPHTAIPIHYDDYTVFKSPLGDFASAVSSSGLDRGVCYLQRGDTYIFAVPASRLTEVAVS